MANEDLPRRTAADKVFRDKAVNVAKNLKFVGYQRGLASVVYKFFDKNTFGTHANKFGGAVKREILLKE